MNNRQKAKINILYCLTFPNAKKYFGITCKSLKRRLTEHNSKSSGCHAVRRAIHKYGINNVIAEVIGEHFSRELIALAEQEAIDKYKTKDGKYGYNLTEGGEGVVGYKHSEEFKTKIGLAHKGKIVSDITKAKMVESGKTKVFSDEHKRNLSLAGKGRVLSREWIEKSANTRRGQKGKPITDDVKAKMLNTFNLIPKMSCLLCKTIRWSHQFNKHYKACSRKLGVI